MTLIESSATQRLQPVAFDLYRDIHKGIRGELFNLVLDTGRIDPHDDCEAAALADQVRRTVQLLVDHAGHEDNAIQPALELHAPALAARVASDHFDLDNRMEWLVELASEAQRSPSRRGPVHELYIELASFTSAYLLHQDLEERQVSQALESALGVDGLLGIHIAIVGNMAPQKMIAGLAAMLPVMNVDDRTELLGGMKATAPEEAFDGVWSLTKSVLTPADSRAVAARLGIV
ncbi:MAG TPA: hemerythrin domain-containing protein [Ilumatobacteraceae bacterium]